MSEKYIPDRDAIRAILVPYYLKTAAIDAITSDIVAFIENDPRNSSDRY